MNEHENKKWQYTNNEKKLIGPFNQEELKEAYKRNEININTDIFHRGNFEWKKLSDWREIKSVWSLDIKCKSCGFDNKPVGDDHSFKCINCGNIVNNEKTELPKIVSPSKLYAQKSVSQVQIVRPEVKPVHNFKLCPICSYQPASDSDPFFTAYDGMGECPECQSIVSKHMKVDRHIVKSMEKSEGAVRRLLLCPFCNNQVSDRAESCPKCGKSILSVALCQICSKEIPQDSAYCPQCGDPEPFVQNEKGMKLPTTQEKNARHLHSNSFPSAATQPKQSVKFQDTEAAIWNPNATVNWSLIFSPAFGSYLQMLNWRTLGEDNEAASSRNWFYVSLGMLAVYGLIYLLMDDLQAAENAAKGIAVLFLIVWYFSAGREQGKYVKEKFGSSYVRKPWGKALFIGVAASIGVIIGLFIFAVIVGLILP